MCFTQAALVRCSLTCVDLTHFTRVILIRNSRLPTQQMLLFLQGKLRLMYEGNPMAMIVEQAGGLASDGNRAILDLVR